MAAESKRSYSCDLEVAREKDVEIFSFDGKKSFVVAAGGVAELLVITSVETWHVRTKFIGRKRQLRVLLDGSPWVGYVEKEQFHVVYPYLWETWDALIFRRRGKNEFKLKLTKAGESLPVSFGVYKSEKGDCGDAGCYDPFLMVLSDEKGAGTKCSFNNVVGVGYGLYDQFLEDYWVNDICEEGGGLMCFEALGVITGYSLCNMYIMNNVSFDERLYMTVCNFGVERCCAGTSIDSKWLYFGCKILFHWIVRLGNNKRMSKGIQMGVRNVINRVKAITNDILLGIAKYLELRYYQLKTKNDIGTYYNAQVILSKMNAWDNLVRLTQGYGVEEKKYDIEGYMGLFSLCQDIIGCSIDIDSDEECGTLLATDRVALIELKKLLIIGKSGVIDSESVRVAGESLYLEVINSLASYPGAIVRYFLHVVLGSVNCEALVNRINEAKKVDEVAEIVCVAKERKKKVRTKRRFISAGDLIAGVFVVDKAVVNAREEERKQVLEEKKRETSLGACIYCKIDVYTVDDHYFVVSCRCHMSERLPLHKKCRSSFNMLCPRESEEIVYIAEFTQFRGKRVILDNRKRYQIRAPVPPIAHAVEMKVTPEVTHIEPSKKKDPDPVIPTKEVIPRICYDPTKTVIPLPLKPKKNKDIPPATAKPKRSSRPKLSLDEFNALNGR
ncbi:MAG: hypothetical protein Hyperionvirus2_202 [Hyperionvirus sp.]|uniref:Uncharacterized protein n=1 Tax=Hyperionvirus sp. TaxID=2487770 RepID=A0A3G5A8K8_9VIRU|nr:MAG: hypothetical protein Hyperionvirus2_202 [Hyperionvirus sp.]